MTWISLVCLLVLASSTFGRSGYDSGYGAASMRQMPRILAAMRDQAIQRQLPIAMQAYGQQQPIAVQGYGQQQPVLTQWVSPSMQQQDMSAFQHKLHSGYGSPMMTQSYMSRALPTQSYGQGYGAMPFFRQSEQQLQPSLPVLTPADILCQGQQAETVIPLENGHKFVVCLTNGKGVEQECPQSLVYHPASQRCERKLGPLENQCAAQPCLNGGQCFPTDSSYQCQCAPGFDGKTCELDARICQLQQPCGQSPDSRCQSFRVDAALQYICIFQDGLAYGLSTQQAIRSPCQGVDGPQALSVSNNGFIMCDGERMFVESCPGGTLWDDVEKACSWPESQVDVQLDQQQGYGQSSYGQQQRTLPQSTYGNQYTAGHQQQQQQQQQQQLSPYGAQIRAPQQYQQPQTVQSYGAQMPIQQHFEQPRLVQSHHTQIIAPKQTSSYGAQLTIPQQLEQPKFTQSYGGQSYGAQMPIQQHFEQPRLVQSHHAQIIAPKQTSSYGAQITIPQQLEQPKFTQSYGGQSYGAQLSVPQQMEQPRLIQSHHTQMIAPKQTSSYGAQLTIPQQLEQPKVTQSYGGQSYGAQMPIQQHFEQPRLVQSHHAQIIAPKQTSSYGAQITIPQQLEQPKSTQSYGSQSYGAQLSVPQQLEQPRLIQSHHAQMIAPKQTSSYGAQLTIPQQLDQPKEVSTYGSQDLLPQLPEQIKFSQPLRQQQDNLVSLKQSSGY